MTKKTTQSSFVFALLLSVFCLFSQSLAAGKCSSVIETIHKTSASSDDQAVSLFARMLM